MVTPLVIHVTLSAAFIAPAIAAALIYTGRPRR